MIITEPNAYVAEVHDRMLLTQGQFEPWRMAQQASNISSLRLMTFLQKWAVSQGVNSSNAPTDDPSLIDKIAA
jgi:putative SOS response-associated peptidase YedK